MEKLGLTLFKSEPNPKTQHLSVGKSPWPSHGGFIGENIELLLVDFPAIHVCGRLSKQKRKKSGESTQLGRFVNLYSWSLPLDIVRNTEKNPKPENWVFPNEKQTPIPPLRDRKITCKVVPSYKLAEKKSMTIWL